MKKNNQFIFYKHKSAFERDLREGNINRNAIVFIEGDTPNDRCIWALNIYFSVGQGLEHSKGIFETYEALQQAFPNPNVGDWAVVLNNNDWKIYTCRVNNQWNETSQTYELPEIEFGDYWNKSEFSPTDYWSKDELLLANGDHFLTENNAEIKYATITSVQQLQLLITAIENQQPQLSEINLNNYYTKLQSDDTFIKKSELLIDGTTVDLTGYVTQEQFDDYTNPINVTLTITPTLVKYIGQPIAINCTYNVTKKGSPITPDSITATDQDTMSTNSYGMFTVHHAELGTKTITITVTKGSNTASESKTVTSVRPTYIFLDTVDSVSSIDLTDHSSEERLLSSIRTNTTLNNEIPGSYLWIITLFDVNKVATDENFTFTVSIDKLGTVNGLNYYRSSLAIDISNITYYIK